MSREQKMFLCSADGHVGAPTERYKPYVEQRYHAAFDEYLKHHQWLWSPAHQESMLEKSLHARLRDAEGFDPERGSAITWDPHFRLREMDKDGLCAEVLVPDDQNSNDPPWGSGLATGAVSGSLGEEHSPEWQRIGARAYNRWLADFCSADHKRLRGLTLLGTLDDVDWCVEELQRAYRAGLTTGVLLPLEYYLPLYHHPRYDPLWATIEELDLTIVSHVSKGGPKWVGNDPRTIARMWSVESAWFSQRPMWCFMIGGVFERFPKLRLAITELRSGWVPQMLDHLSRYTNDQDPILGGLPGAFKLNMTAEEYFRKHVYVTLSAKDLIKRSDLEPDGFHSVPNVLWGSDLGHGEGFWPNGLAELRNLVRGLKEADMREYLGERAVHAYPIRRADYADLMQRIGPTPSQLALAQQRLAA
jgi:predicted TIM-barrel fold metal-dependent hydrolase